MASYFNHLEIANLSSKYYSWDKEIKSILDSIDSKELIHASVPRVGINKLTKKLRDLKYCFLVSKLTVVQTRKIFPPARGPLNWPHSASVGENGNPNEEQRELERAPLEPFLTELYDELLNVESGELDEEYLNNDDCEFHEVVNGEYPDMGDDESSSIAGSEPYYGSNPELGQQVNVVVDCYGIYVPSVFTWLQGYMSMHANRPGTTRKMLDLYEKLKENPELDGPAVLISPELIRSIQLLIAKNRDREVRGLLCLHPNPDFIFLKLVLLHEVGHHVFPAPTKNLSEALANWFAYGFLSYEERLLLHAKSGCQDNAYIMYRGILSMLHLNHLSTIFPDVSFPWPIPVGESLIKDIENRALDSAFKLADLYSEEPWSKLLNWFYYSNDILFFPPFRISHFSRGRNRSVLKLHPAQALGYILIGEILKEEAANMTDSLKYMLDEMKNNGREIRMNLHEQRSWLLDIYKKNIHI